MPAGSGCFPPLDSELLLCVTLVSQWRFRVQEALRAAALQTQGLFSFGGRQALGHSTWIP